MFFLIFVSNKINYKATELLFFTNQPTNKDECPLHDSSDEDMKTGQEVTPPILQFACGGNQIDVRVTHIARYGGLRALWLIMSG